MFYVKNIPFWERALRSLMGIGLIVAGVMMFAGYVQYAVIGTGIIATLTGFFGFCPMCYLYGRKLTK